MKAINLSLVLLLLMSLPLLASTSGNPEVIKLEKLYNDAMFEQVVVTGTSMLERPMSCEDSLAVVRLLAISAAQDNKAEVAESYLLKLIGMDQNADFADSEMSSKFRKVWFKVLSDTKFVPGRKRDLLTVAIVDFDNGSFVDADKVTNMGKGLAEMIRYDLQASGDVYVPSREHIDYLIDEILRSKTDLVDPTTRVEIGKVVGAKSFIFGTFFNLPKGKFRIDARIIETETTLPKQQFKVEGKAKEIGDLVFELSKQIMEYFNIEASKIKEASAKIPEVNLAALNKHSLGITYEELGQYKLAEQAYAAALEISPTFTLATSSRERVQLEISSMGQ